METAKRGSATVATRRSGAASIGRMGASPARLTAPSLLSLIAVASGIFIVSHDFVAVGIALPEIQSEFSAGLESAQWAITGYSIAFSIAVVPGGKVADAWGAGRAFVTGAAALAAAAALVAAAPEAWALLAGRALQGVAVGLLWTAAISVMFAHYGPARAGAAGAVMMVAAGLGTLMGPIDAGLLIEWLDWRAAFAVDVPVCLAAALLVLRDRPLWERGAEQAIDWTGVAILAAALITLLVTLRYAPSWGWGAPPALAGFAATLLAIAVFAAQQRAWGLSALIPPDVVANRAFATSFAGEALVGMSYYAIIALGPQVFANVLGASSIESGLMLAPAMGGFALAAALSGPHLARVPAVVSVPGSGALAALGGLLLALMPDDPTYAALLPGLILVGLGTGVAWSALITVGVSSLSESRSGLAGGLLYMSQLAGGGIGLAAVTAVVTAVSADADPASLPLVQGAQSGFLLAAALGALGVVLTLVGYRGLAARPRAEAELPPV